MDLKHLQKKFCNAFIIVLNIATQSVSLHFNDTKMSLKCMEVEAKG